MSLVRGSLDTLQRRRRRPAAAAAAAASRLRGARRLTRRSVGRSQLLLQRRDLAVS